MSKKFRILSIDGGGIRGIIPGQVLVHVERRIQELTNNPHARVADYFDMVAGTSTGGIIACALLVPNASDNSAEASSQFTASQVVDLYFERGDDIFNIPVFKKISSLGGIRDEKYPSSGIEEALEDYFEELMLSDLLKPCLITAYDIKRRKGHFFAQHKARNPYNGVIDTRHNFLVRDVARCTSAAPTFFECARVKSQDKITYPLVDGGVFVNNPTLCAYAEARNKFAHVAASAQDMAILSIGTGTAKNSFDYQSAKDWGAIEWIQPLIEIMMSAASETADFQLKQIFDTTNDPSQYLRINISLKNTSANEEMDDASSENLTALKELGTELANEYKDSIDAFIRMHLLEENSHQMA